MHSIVSCSATAWNTVRSSWNPSRRVPSTRRSRLILACARIVTAAAGGCDSRLACRCDLTVVCRGNLPSFVGAILLSVVGATLFECRCDFSSIVGAIFLRLSVRFLFDSRCDSSSTVGAIYLRLSVRSYYRSSVRGPAEAVRHQHRRPAASGVSRSEPDSVAREPLRRRRLEPSAARWACRAGERSRDTRRRGSHQRPRAGCRLRRSAASAPKEAGPHDCASPRRSSAAAI
jgi:hypothetical protein